MISTARLIDIDLARRKNQARKADEAAQHKTENARHPPFLSQPHLHINGTTCVV
jgi:hypothetical protein